MPSVSSLLVGLSGPTTVLKAKVFKAKLAQRHVKWGEAWGKRDTNSQRPFPGETAQAGLDLSSTGL